MPRYFTLALLHSLALLVACQSGGAGVSDGPAADSLPPFPQPAPYRSSHPLQAEGASLLYAPGPDGRMRNHYVALRGTLHLAAADLRTGCDTLGRWVALRARAWGRFRYETYTKEDGQLLCHGLWDYQGLGTVQGHAEGLLELRTNGTTRQAAWPGATVPSIQCHMGSLELDTLRFKQVVLNASAHPSCPFALNISLWDDPFVLVVAEPE